MSDVIDTENRDNCVCPHCGYEEDDSEERGTQGRHSGTGRCEKCGEKFNWDRNITITYTTRKKVGL